MKRKRIKHGKLRNLRIADRQFNQLCEPNKKFRRRNFNKALIKRLKSEGTWPAKIDLSGMLQELADAECPVGPTGEIGPTEGEI
jgi:DNA-nicking Smr family endonuclease